MCSQKIYNNSLGGNYQDGFTRICTTGDYPHTRGVQRVTTADLDCIVKQTESLFGKIVRYVRGWPVYRYHPDIDETYNDKTVYGTISDLVRIGNSLYCKIALTSDGARVVAEQGLRWLSPCWECVRTQGYLRPRKLLSIGLTDAPNITTGSPISNSKPVVRLVSACFSPRRTAREIIADCRRKNVPADDLVTKLLRDEQR